MKITKMTNSEMETLESILLIITDPKQRKKVILDNLCDKEITPKIIDRFYSDLDKESFSILKGLTVDAILDADELFDPEIFAKNTSNINILLDKNIREKYPEIYKYNTKKINSFSSIKNLELDDEIIGVVINEITSVLISDIPEYNKFLLDNKEKFDILSFFDNVGDDKKFKLSNFKPSTIADIVEEKKEYFNLHYVFKVLSLYKENSIYQKKILSIFKNMKPESWSNADETILTFASCSEEMAEEVFSFIYEKNKKTLSYNVLKKYVEFFNPEAEFYEKYKMFLLQNGIQKK